MYNIQRILSAMLAALLLLSLASCNKEQPPMPSDGTQAETKPQKEESEMRQVDPDDLYTYDLVYGNTAQSALSVTAEDMQACRNFYDTYVLYNGAAGYPAYDFKIGGVSLRDSLSEWSFSVGEPSKIGTYMQNGITTFVTVTKKDGSVKATVKATIYENYPTCEWTVEIENTGSKTTGAVTDFYAINAEIVLKQSDPDGYVSAYTSRGSTDQSEAFKFTEKRLFAGDKVSIGGLLGKPSYESLPFCNIVGDGVSFVVGVGWSGQWKMDLVRKTVIDDVVRVCVKQEYMNIPLYAGESIRSPLVSMQFYQGNVTKGQNLFRGWVNDCVYRAKTKQEIYGGPIRYDLMQKATASDMITNINLITALQLPVDHFWMDAGWYPLQSGSWVNTGTWTPDKKRFPNGITEVSDAAASAGMDTVLWFEPERVCPGSESYKLKNTHEAWILFPDVSIGGNIGGGEWGLFNFSDDEAAAYMTNLIDRQIKEQKLSVYRQDFNSDPLAYWLKADKTYYDNRTGMCENRYVTNFYSFWDTLHANNEGLIIDNCASGGRRLDLETIRRSVTVWRNDYCHDVTAQQLHTYGISEWLPLHGTGTIHSGYFAKEIGGSLNNTYIFRSQMSPIILLSWDFENASLNWKQNSNLLSQYLSFRSYYRGNYYPLTPFTVSDAKYFAMQFTSDDETEGMVLLYRRPGETRSNIRLLMNGLDPDACYDIYSIDNPDTIYTYKGSTLMQTGVPFCVEKNSTALVLMYKEYKG